MSEPATTTVATTTPLEGQLLQTKDTTVKPGVQTSELYVGLAGKLLGVLAMAGIFGGGQAMQIAGLALVGVIVVGYMISRGLAKGGAAILLVFVLGLGATQLTACATSTRTTTINSTILAADAGCTAFAAYADTHQDTLIQTATSGADAAAKLATFRVQADKVRVACASVYKAVNVAIDANNDQAIAAITQAAQLLSSTLKTFGISLGGSL